MSTKQFIIDDQPKTLFPTKTNHLLIEQGDKYIQEPIVKCFAASEASYSFLPQQRVHAAKYGLNLRRTVKLDPVAIALRAASLPTPPNLTKASRQRLQNT